MSLPWMDRRIPMPRESADSVPVATDARSANREALLFDARGFLRCVRPYLMGAMVLPVIAALYWGQGVLIPVALASLLTFLLSPLVSGLERLGLARFRAGRAIAVAVVVALVFSVLGVTTWVIAQQVLALGSELPAYRGNPTRKITVLRVAGRSGALGRAQSTA